MNTTTDIKLGESVLSEEDGVYKSLERVFLVEDIPTTYTDTRRLGQSLDASGLPAYGSYMPGNTNMICTKRDVRFVDKSNTKAYITCHYQRIADANAQFIFSGGTSLGQTTTQNDIYGNQITVSHTFPADDEDYPNETRTQGVDLSVMLPSTTLVATGDLFIAYPTAVSRFYVGSMNGTWWGGDPPYTWMCTNCSFDGQVIGLGQPKLWRFTFEFQHNVVGWPLQAWYRDERTLSPPPNLVPGVGIKDVEWYGFADFNYLFPNV